MKKKFMVLIGLIFVSYGYGKDSISGAVTGAYIGDAIGTGIANRFASNQTAFELYNETPYTLELDSVRYHDWLCSDDTNLPDLPSGKKHTITWSSDSCILKSVRFKVKETTYHYEQNYPGDSYTDPNRRNSVIIPAKGILKYYVKWEGDDPVTSGEVIDKKGNIMYTLPVFKGHKKTTSLISYEK